MRVNTEFKEVKDIGKIPVDWEVKELKEVCEVLDSKRKPIKQEARVKGNIPYYGATGIIDFINDYIFDEEIILVGEDGENLVSRVLPMAFKVDGKAWVNNHAHVIKPYDDSVDYITYYLDKIDYSLYITGTAQPKLNQEKLSSIKILIPKLKEQEKIAQILSNIDMNIKKTEQAIAKYKQVKKGLMDDLLTGKVRIKDGKRFRETNFKNIKGVGEIPWDWEVKKVEDIVSEQVKDGTHHTPKYKEKGIPFLRVTDIQTNEINTENIKYVSEFEHGELIKRVKPEKGDILYSKNGTIGIAKLVDWNWEFSIFVSLALIKPERKIIEPEYLTQVLNSDLVKKQIKLRAKQGTVTNLHLEEIRELIIVVPELKEQNNISKILFNQDTIIFKEEKYLEKLKKLKSGLMEDLLTGKVRVNTN